VADERVICT